MVRIVSGHGPANIMKHMKGIKFPASRNDIVGIAQQKNQGTDTQAIVEILEKIPDQEYKTPAEILKAVGKIE